MPLLQAGKALTVSKLIIADALSRQLIWMACCRPPISALPMRLHNVIRSSRVLEQGSELARQVCAGLLAGEKLKSLADRLHVSRSTVTRWRKLFRTWCSQ